jgi:diaminohydroxyphosphoribosylaminopyrimidine deaminase/5-amino-6-(5-phosphoribosylamino)uracil reductase
MARALSLAAGAVGRTSPNPAVGAVIVDRAGQVVGEGATRAYGHAHAEALAIAQAGERARGGELYVTLEPCSHSGKNTAPCADAVVAAGISRVVVATLDPNPQVVGRGVARLRDAGIDVQVGEASETARTLMVGFATWIATRRPHVIVKFAASLDGRIATRTGDSRWITGGPARAWAHTLRDRIDAILVGVGTARADDPALTARPKTGERGDDGRDLLLGGVLPIPTGHAPHQPLRVVLDTHLGIPAGSQLASGRLPGTTLFVGVDDHSPEWAMRRETLTRPGVEVATVTSGTDGRPDVGAVLELLGYRGVTTLLVEGGATVHDAFFRAGLVDRVAAVIAPVVIGGGPSAVGAPSTGPDRLADATRLRDRSVSLIGEDVLVTGWIGREPVWPELH